MQGLDVFTYFQSAPPCTMVLGCLAVAYCLSHVPVLSLHHLLSSSYDFCLPLLILFLCCQKDHRYFTSHSAMACVILWFLKHIWHAAITLVGINHYHIPQYNVTFIWIFQITFRLMTDYLLIRTSSIALWCGCMWVSCCFTVRGGGGWLFSFCHS